MLNGVEHDGLFLTAEAIHAYEFTVSPKKEKARTDAQKIATLLASVRRQAENKYKTPTGWFVTSGEPTADQRLGVSEVAKREGVTINCLSYRSLHANLCDGEGYLNCRDNRAFGSTGLRTSIGLSDDALPEIPVVLADANGEKLNVGAVATEVASGARLVLLGQFGVGKSYTLREVFRRLRRNYFKQTAENPMPIHINLRECIGARSASEVLRRHAEEIGFAGDRQLVSLWSSGQCVLLLDGFDEVTSTRQVGSLSDLVTLRWDAMRPIRELVEQAPPSCGILLAGRSHYFSSERELLEDLGLVGQGRVLQAMDFSPEQIEEYLGRSGGNVLPDWVPSRPLLLAYLVHMGILTELSEGEVLSEAKGWRRLLGLIAEREARMVTGVAPETVRALISAVAIEARAGTNIIGPVSMGQMQNAFASVSGRRPSEDDVQVLLRLPGLAAEGWDGGDERVFVDRSLASTAYGEALATYVMNPYGSSDLAQPVPWIEAADELAVAVAVDALDEAAITTGQTKAACSRRDDSGCHDAVLADCIAVLAEQPGGTLDRGLLVDSVLFEELHPGEAADVWGRIQMSNCLIERVDVGGITSADGCPTFSKSVINVVMGAGQWPEALASRLIDTDVQEFALAPTNAGLLAASIDDEVKVALTILRKVYRQRGSGRRESALSRGLSRELRGDVPAVLHRLCTTGWLRKVTSGNSPIYIRVPDRQAAAARVLDQPETFGF